MKKKHSELLRSIYNEVPQEYKDSLMVTQEIYKEIKGVMQLAVNEEGFDPEKKEYYKNLLDSGQLDGLEEVMSPEVAKKIDDFIDERVLAEVEKGNLPKVARTEIMKKIRKYQRTQNDNS